MSLFSSSFLRVFIQLLSYSPSTLKSFSLSSSVSQCDFQSSHYFYPFSTSLLPWSVFSWCDTLPSSLPLYQFCDNNILFFWPIKHKSSKISLIIDFIEIFIFATGIIRWSNFSIFIIIIIFIFTSYTYYQSDFSIPLVLSHTISLSLSLSKSVIFFSYFDKFLSLSLLLYPAIFFAIKSSSLSRYLSLANSLSLPLSLSLSLFIFFFPHLYVTASFLHSLSVCLCLSNYLWFFVSLSLCSAVLLLSVTPLTLSTQQQ